MVTVHVAGVLNDESGNDLLPGTTLAFTDSNFDVDPMNLVAFSAPAVFGWPHAGPHADTPTDFNALEDGSIRLGSEVIPEPRADFNSDGDVDGDDFLHWQTGFPLSSGATKMDGDADGDVDGDDFLIWQTEFPSPGSGSASSAVPEPGSWLLVAVGLSLCLTKRSGSHFVHAA